MANISITNIIATITELAEDLVVDQAELTAGGLVKIGQIASVGGKPIYMYLSENPSAT